MLTSSWVENLTFHPLALAKKSLDILSFIQKCRDTYGIARKISEYIWCSNEKMLKYLIKGEPRKNPPLSKILTDLCTVQEGHGKNISRNRTLKKLKF